MHPINPLKLNSVLLCAAFLCVAAFAFSQDAATNAPPSPHEQHAATPHDATSAPQPSEQQDMAGMDMPGMTRSDSEIPSPHSGSGTAWAPASEPAHEWMLRRG